VKPTRTRLDVCRLAGLTVVGGLLSFGGCMLLAQTTEVTSDESTFFETFSVNTVNVDVVVTDDSGEPVTGLTSSDFEIFEDGQPMEVTNFFVVEEGRRIRRQDSIANEEDRPLAVRQTLPRLEEAERQPLYLVVFVDNVNLRAARRNSAFRDIRTFLYDSIQPGDQVMLVSYERALEISQEFTGDSRRLARALLEMEDQSTNVTQLENERRELARRIEEARSPGQVEALLRGHSLSVQNDLLTMLRAMSELVDSLAGLPGRKALLHVSDGMPMVPGQEFYVAAQRIFPQHSFILSSLSFDATRRFQELASNANSNRVTFYTLDAGGVRVSSAIDVERKGGGREGFATTLDSATVSNLHSSLLLLAEQTGGRAILNTNNFLPSLEDMAGDFRGYYSLGYTPSHSGDGRYYSIEVRVRQKGLSVRHREGYRDKPADLRMSESTMSALRWDLENNPHGMTLQFRSGSGQTEPETEVVELAVRIPLASVVLVPRETIHVGRLRLYLALRDSQGRVAAVREIPVTIEIPGAEMEQALGQDYVYKIPLMMRSGRQRVAVGLLDEIGANRSFVTADIDSASL
jgi:VWFA-related protein